MNKKIGCLFINVINPDNDNYQEDKFFTPNALNSFKKFHPEIEVHYINDTNINSYFKRLGITEYFDNVAIIRIHIIKELMKQEKYTKMIMLGLDTFTCAHLTEFINDDEHDVICSSGPPYPFLKTNYWAPKIVEFDFKGNKYQDVDFINADITCFNSVQGIEMVYEKTLEFYTEHLEQGGLNYCYQNQTNLGIKVKIVDFPYVKTDVLYNVRSKGTACGGNQMHRGNLWSGNYKDPNSSIIDNIYPTSTYYVKDNKLFTKNGKQIKVFHYAEALGVKTKEEYNETLNEIKNMWFNEETKQFLINQCDCNF